MGVFLSPHELSQQLYLGCTKCSVGFNGIHVSCIMYRVRSVIFVSFLWGLVALVRPPVGTHPPFLNNPQRRKKISTQCP